MMNNLYQGMIGAFGGIKIVENYNLVERQQFRFPRSKGKRISKKFSKDCKNYKTKPDPNVYHLPNQNTIVCHPITAYRIRRSLRR